VSNTGYKTRTKRGAGGTCSQACKHKCDKQKGAAKKGAMKTGQRRNNFIFDHNKTESKNRHKNQGFENFLTSTKKNTKSDTILRHLFRQLEPFVQNHSKTELKSRQNGTQFFRPESNFSKTYKFPAT
jgi:hypothetical protein